MWINGYRLKLLIDSCKNKKKIKNKNKKEDKKKNKFFIVLMKNVR